MRKYTFSPSDFYTDGSKVDRVSGTFQEQRPDHLHKATDVTSHAPDGHTQVVKEFRTPLKGEVKVIEGSKWNAIQVTTPDGHTIQFLHASALYRRLNGQTVPAWTPLE